MRLVALALAGALGSCVHSFLVTPYPSTDVSKEVRLEIPAGGDARVAIENLSGRMRVSQGTGESLVVLAHVHAENEALLAGVEFDRAVGDDGRTTYRLRYPLDQHTVFRLPRITDDSPAWTPGDNTSTSSKYGGVRVELRGGSGPLLYADVEVLMPKRAADVAFRLVAGPIAAKSVEGTVAFSTGMGDIFVSNVAGEVTVATGSGDVSAQGTRGKLTIRTGSGDVKLANADGTVECRTGSGNCRIASARGEKLNCATGSGNVDVRGASVKFMTSRTGSGNVTLLEAEPESLEAATGSGNVTFETRSERLAKVEISTGSGDVALQLGDGASFEARASQGSGDLTCRYADAQAVLRGKRVIGYRRGDGKAQLTLRTGSGDVTVGP